MLRTLTYCPGEHNALAVNWEAPVGELGNTMSARRHGQQTRISDSGHEVLDVWLPFCGFETYGGGILVVVEADAAIPGVSGPQRGVSPGWFPMLLLAEV